MAEGSSKKRVAAVVGLWAVVMGAASAVAGCYGHNCDDNDIQFYGSKEGEGRLLSADTWETGPIDGDWLPFPRRRAWVFDTTALGNDRVPYDITPYVSAQANWRNEGGNFTHGAGNLAEISGVGGGQVVVKNGTCADYYVRVVVEAAPRPPSASSSSSDAGTDAEAGP